MKLSFSILLLSLAFFWPGSARAEDPYDPEVKFETGKNEGKVMSSLFNRPTYIVKDQATRDRVGAKPGDLVVANFYTDRRFWIVLVPEGAVKEATVLEQNLIPGAPHLLMSFKLKEGMAATLHKQDPNGKRDAPKEPLTELVVHGVGLFPNKEGFIKPKSLVGHYYNLSNMAMSMPTFKAQNAMGKNKKTGKEIIVNQYPIAGTDEFKQGLLANAMGMGEVLGHQTRFRPFTSNCHTVTLSAIDRTIGGGRVGKDGLTKVPFILTLGSWFPSMQGFLEKRGLWDKSLPPAPTLNSVWTAQDAAVNAAKLAANGGCDYGQVAPQVK